MKQTLIIKAEQVTQPDILKAIQTIIIGGGLVVFPTETVYGIGANALDKEASKKIYDVKGRPSDNPLIVHIGQSEELYLYAREVPDYAKSLIQAFWPGPLTLILKKQDIVPYTTTAGLDTVAIRLPKHETALALIQGVKLPLAAPSANLSGKPSATEFKHVFEDLNGKVDCIIDGGPSRIGIESTVLDCTKEIPTILRPGAVTQSMIERILQRPILDASTLQVEDAPKSPGMKYTHYKPKGDVTILYGPIEKVQEYVSSQVDSSIPTAVICASDYELLFPKVRVRTLGYLSQPEWIAKQLFSALREMDEWGMQRIFIHSFPEVEIGHAVMNRLLKAAGYQTITL